MMLRFFDTGHVPSRRSLATGLFCLAFMLAMAPASAQEKNEAPAAPGTLTKMLRALGLQSPPGARGDRAYRSGDYEEALRQYGRAAEETETPPPLLDRNTANALYRQKRYDEAVDLYGRALKSAGTDSAFAARAHHNLGNTHYQRARNAESAGGEQADAAIADLREATAHYKKALRLNPRDDKARRNLELTDAHLRRLLAQREQNPPPGQPQPPPEPSARAKEALARALQLVQERRYPEAAAVLDDILRTDRTAASFTAHRQRLDDVMKILRGETPAAPAPRDPRATPWNPGTPGSSGNRMGP